MNRKPLKVGDKITLVVAKVESAPCDYSEFHLGPTVRQWVRFEGDNQNNSINLDVIKSIESVPEPICVGDKVRSKNGDVVVKVLSMIDDTWMAVKVDNIIAPQVRKIAEYVHAC